MVAGLNCFEQLYGLLKAHSDKDWSSYWLAKGGGAVSMKFHPISPSWYGNTDPIPLKFIEEAFDAVKYGIGGFVYQSFSSIIKSDTGCDLGVIQIDYYPQDGVNKRSYPRALSSDNFTTGIHYIPWNETIPAETPLSVSLPPKNGPICKREDRRPMAQCLRHDTVVSGSMLSSGMKMFSSNGNFLEFQDDGNLCSTILGNKNWCLMSQHDAGTKYAPYTIEFGANGYLTFRTNVGEIYATYGPGSSDPGKNDGMFRLTIQNDGNVVLYYGSSNKYPLWASSGYVPGQTVEKPCYRKSD
ncbi:hypothetical protein BGZ99_007456 [Dissophora globulifera]|uniref:Bulb-type lectin domain-containing protein n=1 Tax=Dissophora globulifera TaxID=979702 RepID=A0A9P6R9R7_9FUNG|nr:hypothetical protein BGZ99_007456 [Dissophora globulifera]